MDSVLITGADGQIGGALAALLKARGKKVFKTWFSRNCPPADYLPLDLARYDKNWPLPQGIDTVYLCAAITSTAQCSEHPEACRKVNVTGTLELAQRAVDAGARVVFLSTNLVFDGTTSAMPADAPHNPCCIYGAQKAEVEKALIGMGERTVVMRFTKVLSPRMPLFSKWAQDLEMGKPIKPFRDMVFAPVTLALAVQALVAVGEQGENGVFQISASSDVSYADMANRIALNLGADSGLVVPITGSEAGVTMEHVPRYTSLDTTRAAQVLSMPPPDPLAAVDIWCVEYKRR